MTLRVRLSLWYGSALAAGLVLFAVVLYWVMAQDLRDQVDRSLEQAALAAVKALEHHRLGPALPFEDLASEFPELAVLDKFFQIFSPAGKVTIQSPNVRRHDIPLSRTALEAAFAGDATFESAKFRGESPIRLLSVPIRQGADLVNVVQVGTSLRPVEHVLRRLLAVFALAVPLMLGVALVGGWFLAGRALKPVEAVTVAAQRIAAGDLSQRLAAPPSPDEIGRLVATFNDMIARLDASFQQVRRFSADASHELRTPLTVMKGETDLALRRPRAAEDYRLVLESNLEEIDRMSQIIDDLLFLARADLGEVKLAAVPVRLDALVEDIRSHAAVLGQDRHVHVAATTSEPVTVQGDELRLRELILNLVENAIKYSHEGGTVEMALTRRDGEARLSVKDAGIGIAPEDQGRIFERFYRTDAARTHAKQGTGLGLAICQWIAAIHQGRIELESRLNEGSQFTVILPLSTPSG